MNCMSASNKRSFENDSTLSIKKRLCISLVPTVPRGGTNYTHQSSLSPNINLNSNKFSSVLKEKLIFDAGDRVLWID